MDYETMCEKVNLDGLEQVNSEAHQAAIEAIRAADRYSLFAAVQKLAGMAIDRGVDVADVERLLTPGPDIDASVRATYQLAAVQLQSNLAARALREAERDVKKATGRCPMMERFDQVLAKAEAAVAG